MSFSRHRVVLAAALLAALTLGLTACSSDDGAAAPAATPGIPSVSNATDLGQKPVPAAGPTGAPRPTTVLTQDLVTGKGDAAKEGQTVNVKYVGALYTNGTEFDSSWSRGDEPISFSLNEVVPGFAQGIVGMAPGGRRTIVIPAALGYGAAGSPPSIPADADLTFVVDLVGIG